MDQNSDYVPIERLTVSAYVVPTDYAESDGTLEWHKTTLVLVEAQAAGRTGLGYTFANNAAATLIHELLAPLLHGANALSPPAAYMKMWEHIRNLGRPGICAMAISAVDCALWDLKAKILGLPLVVLLGAIRTGALIYGSGGFTSYSDEQLADQLAGWASAGIRSVKMKIGRDPQRDEARVAVAREAIGPHVNLYVDANGAFSPREALNYAAKFSKYDVSWFEEPVSSDDLQGLRLVREHVPAGMDVAAGEYGYEIFYFQRMLNAQAVDVQQADVSRCGGVTGFLQVAALCQAYNVQLSGHTAPALHTHVACAAVPLRNLEYFHDHVRIERMFFDGFPQLVDGALRPDLSRAGIGLELKRVDAQRYAA